MQDLTLLHQRGATNDKLKLLFSGDRSKRDPKIRALMDLHSDRFRAGITACIEEAPIYGAIDHVLQSAQNNVPHIQARVAAMKGKSNEEIQEFFESLGLDRMLTEAVDPADPKKVLHNTKLNKKLLVFNMPVFEQVFLPMVLTYLDLRVGKLVTDLNQVPYYPFNPLVPTIESMARCKVWEGRVQRMTQDMGYVEGEKQSITKMAKYATCFDFAEEPYWREQYLELVNGKVEKRTRAEGVRFTSPHPRRVFWDRSQPLHRLNSDTGVSYAGYWDLVRWETIKNNESYWNTDKIPKAGYDLYTGNPWNVYQMFYPCVAKFPVNLPVGSTVPDRQDKQRSIMTNELDTSVTLGVMFHKLIPKEWGLFDYDQPVWMRFLYANQDECIHCEPWTYTPACVYLHGYSEDQTVGNSLALRLAPFEQMLGNFLTQHFKSVRQNLMRVSFVNTDLVPKEHVNFLSRMKDMLYQHAWFFPFSKERDFVKGEDRREAFIPANTGVQVDVTQITAQINLLMAMTERMIGISPQEVGAAASHEQSASEMTIIGGNQSVQLEYMASGVQAARHAKKRMLATAVVCHGDDEIVVEVTDWSPLMQKALKDIGFEVQDSGDGRYTAKGTKKLLTVETLVAQREGPNRLSDSKMGIQILQLVGGLIANPLIMQVFGLDQLGKIVASALRLAGIPEDEVPKPKQGQPEMPAQEVLKQGLEAAVKQAVELSGQQTAQAVQQSNQAIEQEIMSAATAVKDIMAKLQVMDAAEQGQNALVQQLQATIQMLTAKLIPNPQPVPVPVPQPVPVGVAPDGTAVPLGGMVQQQPTAPPMVMTPNGPVPVQ